MDEITDPKFIGIENDEQIYEVKYFGFTTEFRLKKLSNEATILITDEIAESFGYKSAAEMLGSDMHLDLLSKVKNECGVYPNLKLRYKNPSIGNSNSGKS